MHTKLFIVLLSILSLPTTLAALTEQNYQVKSPNGAIILHVNVGENLQWSVEHKGQLIIAPSLLSMTLDDDRILGEKVRIKSAKTISIADKFDAVHYRQAVVSDRYTLLTLSCKGDYGLHFRVYDDAVAYQFFTRQSGELVIRDEKAVFNFTADHAAFIPIQWDYRDGQNFNSSFEALYHEIKLSQFPTDSLAFLPLLVDVGQGKKVLILEADLEDYPGMYLNLNSTGRGFNGVFAPYPLETKVKGINIIPTRRADYIAKTSGSRTFPWRAVFISEQDKELLGCDMVQKLASPSRITDISWIKVGQVAWDWWNDINISHVDFRAGMNTATYQYYIDFAAKYRVPYILLDAGWNVRGNLLQSKPELDLQKLIAYGGQHGVGLILWCSWQDVLNQKEQAFPFFEKLGIKGMKIDFIDRDDQLAVASTYEIAKLAAEHHLLVDYHGIFKPTGLQRTFPNVVGIEGVKGLENFKWADEDQPRYCVTIPFIRNQAGPMDYTPGSMRNSNQANFRAINDMPMSKGTRVNQMAQYVVFEVPLQMLSDNPTIYLREHECTDFITKIPTTFDESIPLDGQVAEYLAVARRKGTVWFVGAMTNWTPREMTIDLSFLSTGEYRAEVFQDGVNADRDATDYKKQVFTVRAGDALKVKLMNGGGWAARFEKK